MCQYNWKNLCVVLKFLLLFGECWDSAMRFFR